MSGTTIGVLGGTWRATVTAWGDVLPWGDEQPLRWYVAADDRWHVPEQEAAVRQTTLDGAPVVETRVRVPSGDAVHRVWATADGLTVVEVENDSSMPVAVAFTRNDVLTSRPPADVPVQGIDLPASTIVLPVGHRSTVRIALAHDGSGAGTLPDDVSPAAQVARGWTTITERASRVVLPDTSLADAMTTERCRVALDGPVDPADDPVAFLLGVGEVVRMGDPAEPWVIDVVEAAEPLLRLHGRRGEMPWDVAAALRATAHVLAAAGETSGSTDVEAGLGRIRNVGDVPDVAPEGVRLVAWVENLLVRPGSPCTLLPAGFPPTWLGASIEAYRVPASARHSVSYAIRWHGDRPAVLWELTGPAGLGLVGGAADPTWRTSDPTGEALWAAPPAPTSFS